MRRLLSALVLFVSSIAYAITVETLQPQQAGSGEPVVAVIAGPIQCSGVRVFIGSRKAPADSVSCKSSQDESLVGFSLPDASLHPELEAVSGRQTVRVVQAGERPDQQAGTPNFEVIPPMAPILLLRQSNVGIFDFNRSVIAGLRQAISSTYSAFPQVGFEYFTRNQREYVEKKLRESKIPDIKLKPSESEGLVPLGISVSAITSNLSSPLEGANTIPQPQVVMPRFVPTRAFKSRMPSDQNRVCGKDLYVLDRLMVDDLPIGAVLQYVKWRLPAKLLTAPDTMGVPPAYRDLSMDLPVSNLEWQRTLNAIGYSVDSAASAGNGSRVFILDTLDDNGQDSARNLMPPKHGYWVEQIIRSIAGSAQVFPIRVCDGRECPMDQVIRALCEIGAMSAANPDIPHLINFSMAATNDNPMLSGAIQDIMSAGVAVVSAYGNNDRCKRAALRPVDYCNAVPADLTARLAGTKYGALYSVGAAEQNNRFTHYVQRGERMSGAPAYPWGSATLTRPSISAPGSYQWNGVPYFGTSFATPVVTAALALWAQQFPDCNGRWPTFKPSQNFLKIETLLQLPCPE